MTEQKQITPEKKEQMKRIQAKLLARARKTTKEIGFDSDGGDHPDFTVQAIVGRAKTVAEMHGMGILATGGFAELYESKPFALHVLADCGRESDIETVLHCFMRTAKKLEKWEEVCLIQRETEELKKAKEEKELYRTAASYLSMGKEELRKIYSKAHAENGNIEKRREYDREMGLDADPANKFKSHVPPTKVEGNVISVSSAELRSAAKKPKGKKGEDNTL